MQRSKSKMWPCKKVLPNPLFIGHVNPRNESTATSHSSLPRRSGEIKRLLLTRRYKHENIFKDLGIRVVGGKKLSNGDLGAFITSIDKGRAAQETLGELREGNQVLEWNGVLLSGKTYEEVERIMQAGTGEIELIVCSHRKGGTQKKNIYDGDDEEEEDDDAKINGQNAKEEEDIGTRIARITQGCYDEDDWTAGRIAVGGGGPKRNRQLAFADDSNRRGIGAGQGSSTVAKWGQSPNEPPPIPAHQSSNSISGEEEGGNGDGGGGGGGGSGRNLPRQPPRAKRSTSSVEREKRMEADTGSGLDEHPSIGMNGFGGRTGRSNGSHGYLQLAFSYDQLEQILRVRIIAARALQMRERGIAPNAFVKIYLMPNKKVSNKRRTKYVPHSANPVWDQQIDYMIGGDLLARYSLEFTVYDYRRTENHPLGQCTVNLSDLSIVFSGTARWFALQPPPTSNAENGSGGYANSSSLPNGGIAQIEHQKTTTTRFMDYNPATLDILNGYPAIA